MRGSSGVFAGWGDEAELTRAADEAVRVMTGRRTAERMRAAVAAGFVGIGMEERTAAACARSLPEEFLVGLASAAAGQALAAALKPRRGVSRRASPGPSEAARIVETPVDGTGFVPARGALVAGDEIRFEEQVYAGRWGRSARKGSRRISAKVLRESFGVEKQGHTYTLEVISAEGTGAPAPGERILRKAATLFEGDVRRRIWNDEAARAGALEEQTARRQTAAEARRARLRTEFGRK